MISIPDLYWLAGLLEGEGSFGISRQGRTNGRVIYVSVVSTDEDVIRRVHSILNFGYSGPLRVLPSGKTAYRWACNAQSNAVGLMMTLLPLMGQRRAADIKSCIEIWKDKPLPHGMWTHCKHGHELSGDNLMRYQEGKYTKRRCRECARLREQKRKRKRRPTTTELSF
jgi:hypothetical protein